MYNLPSHKGCFVEPVKIKPNNTRICKRFFITTIERQCMTGSTFFNRYHNSVHLNLSAYVPSKQFALTNYYTVAIEVPGGNRIRRRNIKAQHSAFSRAINRTVSYGYICLLKVTFRLNIRHLRTRYKIH